MKLGRNCRKLFQSRPNRHIFEEACQHCLSAVRRCGHDHAIRFQSAQFSGSKIGHDYNFASDQRLRRVRFSNPGQTLSNFRSEIHFQTQQLVGLFTFSATFTCADTKLDLREIIDADFRRRRPEAKVGQGALVALSGRLRRLSAKMQASPAITAARTSLLLFHLSASFRLRSYRRAETRLQRCQVLFPAEVVPILIDERKISDIAQAKL